MLKTHFSPSKQSIKRREIVGVKIRKFKVKLQQHLHTQTWAECEYTLNWITIQNGHILSIHSFTVKEKKKKVLYNLCNKQRWRETRNNFTKLSFQ